LRKLREDLAKARMDLEHAERTMGLGMSAE
jgi:hypothetical protein